MHALLLHALEVDGIIGLGPAPYIGVLGQLRVFVRVQPELEAELVVTVQLRWEVVPVIPVPACGLPDHQVKLLVVHVDKTARDPLAVSWCFATVDTLETVLSQYDKIAAPNETLLK